MVEGVGGGGGDVAAFTRLVDDAFRQQAFTQAFAVVRAGVHALGVRHEPLCKRYLLMLESVAKAKEKKESSKKDQPPRVLYLRELLASLPAELTSQLRELAGDDAVQVGDKCVLLKERRVMVVGLLLAEWRVLMERGQSNDRMQLIHGVEEAVIRGLSQVEATPEMSAELKVSWNQWALRLCESTRAKNKSRKNEPRVRSPCDPARWLRACLG